MNLTPDQTDKLDRVREARQRLVEAHTDARNVALEAVAAGVPTLQIAEAIGLGRTTLWRRLNEPTPADQEASAEAA